MFLSHRTKTIKRLLVMRFSAMGDAAMTVPVLHALATQHPELRITMLTRSRFVPMFEWLPANVQVKGIDLNNYSGIGGLTRLYRQLKSSQFDAVADLHDVLRTKYLRTCFSLAGTPVAVIDKGRKDKKALIGHSLDHKALCPMPERYANVFRSIGIELTLPGRMNLNLKQENFAPVRQVAGTKQPGQRWVGIAPFAAHPQKIYPLERMQQVVYTLADRGLRVFLFGAGKTESSILSQWENDYAAHHKPASSKQSGAIQPAVLNISGALGGLKNEMLLMSQLDVMLSMDSANMHIASILGTPVISIWGATHPKAGFSGYGQDSRNEQQLSLPCRPCSIYGKKPCQFGDLRCMNIAPETIVKATLNLLQDTSSHA